MFYYVILIIYLFSSGQAGLLRFIVASCISDSVLMSVLARFYFPILFEAIVLCAKIFLIKQTWAYKVYPP